MDGWAGPENRTGRTHAGPALPEPLEPSSVGREDGHLQEVKEMRGVGKEGLHPSNPGPSHLPLPAQRDTWQLLGLRRRPWPGDHPFGPESLPVQSYTAAHP